MLKDYYKINSTPLEDMYHVDPIKEAINENPLKELKKRVQYQKHYRPEEQGVYHPHQKQVLKMRNNGAIDLFANQDTGVRVGRDNQTVEVFANHQKSHVYHDTKWVIGDHKEFVEGHKTMKTRGKTMIHGKDTITIKGEKNFEVEIDEDQTVHIKGNSTVNIDGNQQVHIRRDATVIIEGDADIQINGNMNANVKQHAKIEVGQGMHINSKDSVTIESDRDITLRAGQTLRGYGRYIDIPHKHPEYSQMGHSHG